jgi:asparagine synthase (glutamine-hydrolysing)
VFEPAIAFSGGLDSSLVAKTLDLLGEKVILYTVGLDEAHDLKAAEYAASELNLPLRIRVLCPEEIESYMSKVIYAIEDVDLMKTGVGIPFYAACELASKDKMKVILTGQGSDELFAGYDKYLRILINRGYAQLQDELWMDLAQMYQINLQRDDAVAMANSVELCSPFLDLALVNAAMSINPRLKIAGPTDLLRKGVLREVAKSLGLPRIIVDKPKKSIQYGSGSEKAIRQLAKSKGFKDPRKFINSVFKQMFTSNLI